MSKKESSMTPIKLSPDLRIIDMDKSQYAIQRRGVSKGEEVWQSITFCTTPKSLAQSARDRLASIAADKARTAAHKRFDGSGLEAEILALPKKTRSKQHD